MIAILLFSLLDKPDNEGAWYKLLENIGGLKINYNATTSQRPSECNP